MSPKSVAAPAQGRALAILLPSFSFQIHTLFLIVALHESTFDRVLDWPKSYFVAFNFCAAAAGLLGMWGAIKANTTLVATCTAIHATTLLLTTLTLLNILLPFDLRTFLPILPNLNFDVNDFCRDDDGFGWDEHWQDQCRDAATVVKLAAGWTGLFFMAVQWWALVTIWKWNNRVDAAGRWAAEMGVEEEEGYYYYESNEKQIRFGDDYDEDVEKGGDQGRIVLEEEDVKKEEGLSIREEELNKRIQEFF